MVELSDEYTVILWKAWQKEKWIEKCLPLNFQVLSYKSILILLLLIYIYVFEQWMLPRNEITFAGQKWTQNWVNFISSKMWL